VYQQTDQAIKKHFTNFYAKLVVTIFSTATRERLVYLKKNENFNQNYLSQQNIDIQVMISKHNAYFNFTTS